MNWSTRRVIALFASTLVALSSPAFAQNDVCIDPQTGYVNQQATQGWQQFQARADRQAMAALTGVWSAEIRSPATGQVDYRQHMFEPNGLFQYASRVCSNVGLCSPFQGHGFWASQFAGDGTLVTMTIVSDQSRNRLCGISYGRFMSQTVLVDTNNIRWTKVR